jgi:hypothetical protein
VRGEGEGEGGQEGMQNEEEQQGDPSGLRTKNIILWKNWDGDITDPFVEL